MGMADVDAECNRISNVYAGSYGSYFWFKFYQI